jgi:hypothetical protein
MFRIVSNDTDSSPIHPSKSGDDVLGIERHHLEKLALINDA